MSATSSEGESEGGKITALSEPLSEVTVDYIAALAQSGIDVAAPRGYVEVDVGCRYACIGFVAVMDSGIVVAVHCIDATAEQVGEVIRQAENAVLDGPIGPHWTRIPDRGFEMSVLEPIVAGTTSPTPPDLPFAQDST